AGSRGEQRAVRGERPDPRGIERVSGDPGMRAEAVDGIELRADLPNRTVRGELLIRPSSAEFGELGLRWIGDQRARLLRRVRVRAQLLAVRPAHAGFGRVV